MTVFRYHYRDVRSRESNIVDSFSNLNHGEPKLSVPEIREFCKKTVAEHIRGMFFWKPGKSLDLPQIYRWSLPHEKTHWAEFYLEFALKLGNLTDSGYLTQLTDLSGEKPLYTWRVAGPLPRSVRKF